MFESVAVASDFSSLSSFAFPPFFLPRLDSAGEARFELLISAVEVTALDDEAAAAADEDEVEEDGRRDARL